MIKTIIGMILIFWLPLLIVGWLIKNMILNMLDTMRDMNGHEEGTKRFYTTFAFALLTVGGIFLGLVLIS